MNKIVFNLALTLTITLTITSSSYADATERAKVIKFDKVQSDLIVRRADGNRWLIQHNYQCGSYTTEYPVELIKYGSEVKKLKVRYNEICNVYNTVPYSGEATLRKVHSSDNALVKNHEAELEWDGKRYLIDYGPGCKYLGDFKDTWVYFSNLEEEGGTLVMPGNRGQCSFEFKEELEVLQTENPEAPPALEGLDHQAQVNQVYLYWKKQDESVKKKLYLISNSRFKIDPSDYRWQQMPKLIKTRRNSFTVRRLKTGRPYYFYLAAMDEDGNVGPWSEIKTIPVAGEGFKNQPDFDEFEIELEDKGDHFYLTWPMMENTRRYITRFYVDGKSVKFKILKPGVHEYIVPKLPEYLNKRMRFTVRSITKIRQSHKWYDGHFWVYKEGE